MTTRRRDGAPEEGARRAAPEPPSTFRWSPGPSAIGAALAASPLALAGPAGGLGALAIDAAAVVISYGAARRLAHAGVHAERITDGRWVLGAKHEVTLRLTNPSDRALRVTVRDDLPEGFSPAPTEHVVVLPPRSTRDLRYQIVPPARGDHVLGNVHLKIEGGLRLGAALVEEPLAATVRVYPNVLGGQRRELASRVTDLRRSGLRNVRLSGGGGEFAQLREYVQGDPPRDFDWKATAKRQRPVTKVREHERAQSVVLAIDAGRMMAAALTEGSSSAGGVTMTKLDHALDAALLTAHVALRSGDRVGLIVFAEDVRLFVPPARGLGHYRRLLDATYRVKAELAFVDFRRLAEFVKLRVPKRSLLVVLTDFLDEAHAMPLAREAKILGRKHLLVCVSMKDSVADSLAAAPVARDDEAWARAAAAELVLERETVKAHLARSGVGLVEAPPSELSFSVVNRYLDIKARARL
jgi:uncharacterized protein (DUF58 family)